MRKGQLIYESPDSTKFRKLLSIVIISIGPILGFYIGNIFVLFLLSQATLILGTTPNNQHPIIHKRYRIYTKGLDKQLGSLTVLINPSRKMEFFSFASIRAFERGPNSRRCVIFFNSTDGKSIERGTYIDPRYGMLDPIFDALIANGIPEVDKICPQCGKDSFYLSDICRECKYNRITSLGEEDKYFCEKCTNQLDYINDYERWYCSSCEEYQ